MVSFESPEFRLRSFLGSVKDVDVAEHIVRRQALGEELDFSDCEGSFVEFQDLASAMANVAWGVLPADVQESVLDGIRDVQQAYFAITEFAASEGKAKRDELAETFHQRLDDFLVKTLPYAGFLLWKQSGVERRARLLLQNIEETSADIRSAHEEIEAKRSDVDDVLKAARGSVAELGASREAQAFHAAASRYERSASRWLKASVASALATIVVGILVVFVWNTLDSDRAATLALAILGRAAVLGVLTYATVTAVRMYRSNAHLAVVNRHREDALQTFRTFIEGTDSVETKSQILLAAAHAAFGQTATGLIGEKADGANTLEVFEGLFGRSVRGS